MPARSVGSQITQDPIIEPLITLAPCVHHSLAEENGCSLACSRIKEWIDSVTKVNYDSGILKHYRKRSWQEQTPTPQIFMETNRQRWNSWSMIICLMWWTHAYYQDETATTCLFKIGENYWRWIFWKRVKNFLRLIFKNIIKCGQTMIVWWPKKYYDGLWNIPYPVFRTPKIWTRGANEVRRQNEPKVAPSPKSLCLQWSPPNDENTRSSLPLQIHIRRTLRT